MLFNLTMAKAPEFSNEKGEIIIHLDGNFESDDMRTYVPENTLWIDYTSVEQKE